ncbi:MAG: ABC transporter ATP-binding protein [Muribaculaceae bacterium]|nr:ABC transporter ATP-binding protein [Muribaculaceae bacterium]
MTIELTDLHYRYRRSAADAIDGITATIGPGIHLLLGENGAGKTTLLHLIDGLLFPTSGQCTADGGPTRLRLPSVTSRVAFLGAGMPLPALTIREMTRIHAPFYPRFSAEMLAENLAAFGIGIDQKLSAMSMGTKQKAAVAYMLALRTEILLLDEPATGLDIASKQALQKMIARCVDPDQTVIVSTHNIADLEYLYDGVTVIRHGRLLLSAATDAILSRIRFVSSPVPPAEALYCESGMGGFRAIVPNADGADSAMDYRLLYSALHKSELLTKYLSHELR